MPVAVRLPTVNELEPMSMFPKALEIAPAFRVPTVVRDEVTTLELMMGPVKPLAAPVVPSAPAAPVSP